MRTLLITLVIAYLLCGLLMTLFQRHLLYFPTLPQAHYYDTLNLTNQQTTLNIIRLNSGQENALIYFGGNAESVVFNAPYYQQNFPHYTIYLVNYRGYDKSEGKPSEKALYEDALHLYDRIQPHHAHVSVIGRSLGSGVATFLATQRAIRRMILVTPYDSVMSLAKANYPMYPIDWMLSQRFDSLSRVPQIKIPSLIVMAEHDSVIPQAHSINLINAFSPHSPRVVTIANSNHDDLIHRASYHTALQQFLNTP